MKSNKRRTALAVLLATIVAAAGFAFAAANTVPASNAGEGSGAIGGFTASAIHYTLDAANPANISGVAFTLAPAVGAGGTVRAALGTGAYVNCGGGGTSWSCPLAGGVLGATSLSIVAAD